MRKALLTVLTFCACCTYFSQAGEFKPVFWIENAPWLNDTHVGYTGHLKIPVEATFHKWWIALIYTQPIVSFVVWQARYWKSTDDKHIVFIKNGVYNGRKNPGEILDIRFMNYYERLPGIDYADAPTVLPAIVFNDKVYIPKQEATSETPMKVVLIKDYASFPNNFVMHPVETISTIAPVTRAPLTKGANSGFFWWVYTRSPPPTRAVWTTPTDPTTPVGAWAIAPETTRSVISCEDSLKRRQASCAKTGKSEAECFLPQCSKYDLKRYSLVQCSKYLGSCWCVDSLTGVRNSRDVAQYKSWHELSCIGGSKVTGATITPTTPPVATLASGEVAMTKPPFIPRTNFDYNLIIHNSLLFFEAQRSGNIGQSGRIVWRSSAHTRDGSDCGGLDLAGGYYLSGDYVKFGFPTAFATTMLAWGFKEFQDAYVNSGETEYMKEALKWAADYFMKAHTDKYTLVGQVGDPENENNHWTRPEHMRVPRPCFKVTSKSPGSDLAGETAAALAATAKVWLLTGSSATDPYVSKLIRHAKDLYDFATKFRGTYSFSIRSARKYYPSTSYKDEIVWAALWLYEATGELRYLADAGRLYSEFSLNKAQGDVSWDNKVVPVQILLAQNTYRTGVDNAARKYTESVVEYCNNKLPGGGSRYTPQGLLFINEWGSNRYALNSAFACLVASKLHWMDSENRRKYRKFAEDQMDYVLGKTGKSFVIGYGSSYPKRPHHRPSSCSLVGACGWDFYNRNEDNPQVLVGALVGGPDAKDTWENDRTNFKTNGVSLDHNAALQNTAAGLRHFQIQYNTWKRQQTNP